MSGQLAQNVRAKLFQDYEQSVDDKHGRREEQSTAVQAMLCGFILEGEDFNPAPSATNNEQDWFYKL